MKCIYHPEREAAGTCVVCGKPFCEADIVRAPDGLIYCRADAASLASGAQQSPGGLAIASLALSAASIFFCALTAIPGLVMGLVELNNIKKGESPPEGRGFALAGAIIGGVVLGLVVLVFLVIAIIAIVAAAAS